MKYAVEGNWNSKDLPELLWRIDGIRSKQVATPCTSNAVDNSQTSFTATDERSFKIIGKVAYCCCSVIGGTLCWTVISVMAALYDAIGRMSTLVAVKRVPL